MVLLWSTVCGILSAPSWPLRSWEDWRTSTSHLEASCCTSEQLPELPSLTARTLLDRLVLVYLKWFLSPSFFSQVLLLQEELVYAVEFSHRSGRDLLNVAKKRPNIIPIVEDARHPHKYRMLVGESNFMLHTFACFVEPFHNFLFFRYGRHHLR